MKVIIVTGGRAQLKEIEGKKATLEEMQAFVDGYVENVPKKYNGLNSGKYTLTVDEEGMYRKITWTKIGPAAFKGPIVITKGNGGWNGMDDREILEALTFFGLPAPVDPEAAAAD
jgi:hypothetical protein